jgi:hypothetical protein
MSKRFGAVVAVALLLGLGACSSGGGAKLSKADYTTKASAICTRVTKEIKGAEPKNFDTATPTVQGAAIQKVADYSNQAISDLKDLKAPDELADGVKNALQVQQEGTNKIDALAKDLSAGKKVDRSRYQEISKDSDKSNAAWDKTGIKKCGSKSN